MKKLLSFLLVLALFLPCAFAGAYYDENDMSAVLDALDKNSYKSCYAALLEGDILEKGASGDNAKALQRVLKAFGEDVSTDGKAGSGTFKALNKVQKRYGMEQTDYVDAEVFAELLCALLVYKEGAKAEDYVLDAGMDASQYLYCLARKQASDGHYYLAKKSYEESQWADWAIRANSCVKDWPESGCIWKSSSIGSGSTLKITVENADTDDGSCFKIYNADGKLVAVLFIGGNGSAQTSLKAGRYTIKQGNGKDWYDRKDAFGEDGWYMTWTFDGADSYELKDDYIYTLTTNIAYDRFWYPNEGLESFYSDTIPKPKGSSMPVMPGTTLEDVLKAAKAYGMTRAFSDENFGHGTMMCSLSNRNGGLTLNIVYSTSTNEVLCGSIVTFNILSTAKEQKAFIKDMASVLCPEKDQSRVTKWVKSNVGSSAETTIDGFVYEVALGPSGNCLYFAGERNWEEWELSQVN